MIVLELAFDDDPARLRVRLRARSAHRRRLVDLHGDGTLVMAGPWGDETGALLVFDAERSEVDQIMADDPYYATDGVRVVALREWLPVVP